MATSSKGPSSEKPSKASPVPRAALRYIVSPQEYKVLHQYILSRSPTLQRNVPTVARYEAALVGKDHYNAAAVRATARVFVAAQTGLKAWELMSKVLFSRGKAVAPKPKQAFFRSTNFRLSLSVSSILLFHRLLYRFFTRLRANLLTPDARPFRIRNPKVSRGLTSELAPAVGASLAGFLLGLCPSDQLRVTVAIYALSRAAEFWYNKLEDDGWFKARPWWFGSWLLMPLSCGQLLHAFVFDRDCFPRPYGDFIMKYRGSYIPSRPPAADYPSSLPWPGVYPVVDSLSTMAKTKWPPFISPILFPNLKVLPTSLSYIAPITDPAHPAIKALSCAVLHPQDPSCLRTYVTYYIRAFPAIVKFFALFMSAMALPRYRAFYEKPFKTLDKLAKSILRMSLFVTGAIGTAWGCICLFQNILPRTFLPTQRFFVGGFVGGLWGFLERSSGRGQFLYSARSSLDSTWKVGVKRGWWRGVRGGDVWLFVASLAVVNVVFERDARAVSSGIGRRGLGFLRGEGFADRLKSESSQDGAEHRQAQRKGS